MLTDDPDPATAVAEWQVWSTKARVVVTDPAALGEARRLVADQLAAVDAAASRFRDDSELSRIARAGGSPRLVSPLLAELVAVALHAAESTDGDVDPTLGDLLATLGYDRDIALIRHDGCAPGPTTDDGLDGPAASAPPRSTVRRGPAWRRIVLDGEWLTVPPGVQLDLGATAKAHTADRCAALVAERLGVGVLVSLGGDLATAGDAPPGGWRVRAQDRPGEPASTVTLAPGAALATSSTIGRRWLREGRVLHHVLDPRTCRPADPVWRTVTVAARSCLAANTASTASVVRGIAATGWLHALGLPARLVRRDKSVLTLTGWPADEPVAPLAARPFPAAAARQAEPAVTDRERRQAATSMSRGGRP
ncbi:FAD:protein FMN transferase [Frankia sp. AgB1.9]|uniref:FAD:protein FMN transferase n=1 Tax=unclassified Frankia TaxID=2632575 RepID=UPI001932FCF6|nr:MULTISPECIES: FAD:protein FMN transferase [unclassified Frankia]MBL7488650.1 FAD:protein FMN transferase [Frankia sp. AgW1.1]MBL7551770.1 FAD:protein FMN transferase [Frankia sp. AgB1.9]MBL7621091.1 FAD:protein FMN transferase [Frankia sp. AgB1.8]